MQVTAFLKKRCWNWDLILKVVHQITGNETEKAENIPRRKMSWEKGLVTRRSMACSEN